MAKDAIPFVIAGLADAINLTKRSVRLGSDVIHVDASVSLEGLTPGADVLIMGYRTSTGRRIARQIIRSGSVSQSGAQQAPAQTRDATNGRRRARALRRRRRHR